ncbi:organic cation transporter protein-like [Palaemon carinicauda]|uniref:organic cation transporter protein-like n=1 Tax=Palaemon carinicauda TaxID=392227 RepID=UPI0035B5783B
MSTADGLDEFLSNLGTGRWNYLSFGAAAMVQLITPAFQVSSEFLNPETSYTCDFPDYNQTKPVDGLQCEFIIEDASGQEKTVACEKWIYDTSVFKSTVLMEWNLVCGRAYLFPLFQSIYTAGNFFGAILAGISANRYGRRWSLRAGISLMVVLTVVLVLSPWFWLVLLTRFLLGVCSTLMLFPSSILAMEVCNPRHRATVGILTGIPYALSLLCLAGLAYLIRYWRLLQVAAACPCLIFLVLAYFLDESPRWLIMRGRLEEAIKVLQKAVSMNRPKCSEDLDVRAFVYSMYEKQNEPVVQERKKSVEHKQNESAVDKHYESVAQKQNESVVQELSKSEVQKPQNEQEGIDTSHNLHEAKIKSALSGSKNGETGHYKSDNPLGLDDGFGPWWAGPAALLRTKVIRNLVLVMFGMWALQGILYLGLVLISGSFSSPFLYMALLGAFELFAYSFTAPVVERFGRKTIITTSFISCGVLLFSGVCLMLAGIQNEWLHMVICMISYYFICTSYQTNLTYTPELFPTTLRPWGTTFCSLANYVGYNITPFISEHDTKMIPSIAFTTFAIIAGLLTTLLPETKGRDLPETTADLKNRLDKEKAADMKPQGNKNSSSKQTIKTISATFNNEGFE